jgi:hypothetical protein
VTLRDASRLTLPISAQVAQVSARLDGLFAPPCEPAEQARQGERTVALTWLPANNLHTPAHTGQRQAFEPAAAGRINMSSTPPKKGDADAEVVQSPESDEQHKPMDRDPETQGQGLEVEVKEQDRWLPIANG